MNERGIPFHQKCRKMKINCSVAQTFHFRLHRVTREMRRRLDERGDIASYEHLGITLR